MRLKNIFASVELEMEATVSKMETVQTEGQRSVTLKVEYFNLDAVMSLGYRVNSNRATRFQLGGALSKTPPSWKRRCNW